MPHLSCPGEFCAAVTTTSMVERQNATKHFSNQMIIDQFFYPVKLSFLFLFFPPPPSILSKSLSAPPLPVSVSFFLVGGLGVLFIFFPLRLMKNHQFENVTLPLTKVQSPAARWGGGAHYAEEISFSE